MRSRRSIRLMMIASLLGGGAAEGQEVRGTVRDAETARPVVLPYVALVAEGRELVAASLGDDRGRFSLRAPAPGSYFLYVVRSGYRPVLDGLFELGAGGVVEVTVGLTPAPVGLDRLDVVVEGGVRDLRAVGYYERKALGLGHFIERETIDRLAFDDLTDALRGIPQLAVLTPGPTFGFPTELLNPAIVVRRGGQTCSPDLYIDGGLVAFGSPRGNDEPVRPDDYVDPSDVEAVEVYTGPADVPVAYEGTGVCGVVLVWTRIRG